MTNTKTAEAREVLEERAAEIARRLKDHVAERDSLVQQLWDLSPDADLQDKLALAGRVDDERDIIERLA